MLIVLNHWSVFIFIEKRLAFPFWQKFKLNQYYLSFPLISINLNYILILFLYIISYYILFSLYNFLLYSFFFIIISYYILKLIYLYRRVILLGGCTFTILHILNTLYMQVQYANAICKIVIWQLILIIILSFFLYIISFYS